MARGDGRQARCVPTTDFGRRLEAEFVALGYETMADRARACSGFRRDVYPAKIEPVHIRQWLTGTEPRLGAVKVLEAIGVDVHYCMTGQRSGTVAMRPEDGFDIGAFAERVAAFPGVSFRVQWSAAETLRTIRFRDEPAGGVRPLLDAFESVIRLRARAAGCNPITTVPPTGVTHYEWLVDAELVRLHLWFMYWCRDFGIELCDMPRAMIAASPELTEAVKTLGEPAVLAMATEVWERGFMDQLRATAFWLASDPPVNRAEAA